MLLGGDRLAREVSLGGDVPAREVLLGGDVPAREVLLGGDVPARRLSRAGRIAMQERSRTELRDRERLFAEGSPAWQWARQREGGELMGRQLIIRLFQSFLSLIGMSLLIFILVRVSGDPVDLMRTSTTTEADLANIRAQWGLDKSYPEQYWTFLSGLVRGDLGTSLIQRRPVTTMIGEALPNSLALAGLGFAIGIGLAVVLGVLAATNRDSWLDNGVKFLAILGQALPGFWVGIVAIYIFSVYWHLLPTSGVGDLSHYVLPALTLAFFLMPGMMRLVRSSMLDVLGSEYVKLARIKGLPERTVIWKHALRNALIAPLTAAGAIFASLITGAVILETVFAWPGVGRLMVTAVSGRDFPVVQGITLMVAVVVLAVNLLVDITYAYVDPRIRL